MAADSPPNVGDKEAVPTNTNGDVAAANSTAATRPSDKDSRSGADADPPVFSFDAIKGGISKHLERSDFESKLWIKGPADFVKDRAKDDLLRAIGVMTYVDNLELQVQSIRKTLGASDASTKDQPNTSSDGTQTSAPDKDSEKERWIVDVQSVREVRDAYNDPKEITDDQSWLAIFGGGGYVMKHVRCYGRNAELTGELVKIASPHLRQALQTVIKFGDADLLETLSGTDEVAIAKPYWTLFYNRRRLQEYSKTKADPITQSHLSLLLGFIEKSYPEVCKKQAELEERIPTSIESNFLWMLYEPGTIVYTKSKEDWLAFKIVSVREKNGRPHGLWLRGKEFSKDGKLEDTTKFRLLTLITKTTSIVDLEIIPASMHPDKEQLHKQLLERGRQYWSFRDKPVLKQYVGGAWPRRDISEPLRVVIDIRQGSSRPGSEEADIDEAIESSNPLEEFFLEKYFEMRTYVKAFQATTSKKKEEEDAENPRGAALEPSEESLILCPATIKAFALRMKTEETIELRLLQEIVFEEGSWNKLVVPSLHKKLVTSMVKAYANRTVEMKDLVRGKGQGLVILLHGPPGTGKTLTAECVAEQQRRSLLMITCGDLGTEASILENKLREAFTMATRWNAILLLDEADVFLQERDITQLHRNALVSVFLREIEYFDGILFLTTNRPGLLDEAFQSRIHLTLSMPELDVVSQLRVWRLFLFGGRKELADSEKSLLNKIKKITDGLPLNGRQIRNHVMTARALAVNEQKDLSIVEIEQVLNISREFEEYLEELNEANNATRANELGTRLPSARSVRAGKMKGRGHNSAQGERSQRERDRERDRERERGDSPQRTSGRARKQNFDDDVSDFDG